jgi:outer membrane protein assembly factor BamB
MSNDLFSAINMNTGQLKWTHAWIGGHGDDTVSIGSDGTLYTVRNQQITNTMTLEALNPDGTIKWQYNITNPDAYSMWPTSMSVGADGTLYFGAYDLDSSYNLTGNGALYAFNPSTQTMKWIYPMTDLDWYPAPAIGKNGTIYITTFSGSSTDRNVLAINPDGTLKWSAPYGTSDNYGGGTLSLMGSTLLVSRESANFNANDTTSTEIQAYNTSNGSLIWTKNDISNSISFTNSNSIYYSDLQQSDADNFTATTGQYDQNLNPYWQAVLPFDDIDTDNNNLSYTFQTIGDDRGWVYGSLNRAAFDGNGNLVNSDSGIQYFAMAPWTVSLNSVSGSAIPGSKITFNVTSTMDESNPLLSGANEAQIIFNNTKIPLTYVSTKSNDNTTWTGSYTIPNSTQAGSYNYSLEAAQSGVKTNTVTHFASPANNSDNTGIVSNGTVDVTNAGTVILTSQLINSLSSSPSSTNGQPIKTEATTTSIYNAKPSIQHTSNAKTKNSSILITIGGIVIVGLLTNYLYKRILLSRRHIS